ncbi:hypothetical protein PybrP1_004051 [[Pythium] brassicae (nom. inval.)]|nr:hypothetical protein PybrP1_004051 [[Pythium] brassicae (nom. inval.)]
MDAAVREETVDAAGDSGSAPQVPPLSEEEFAKIMAKVSDRCVKQVQENPTDPSKVSDRCRAEVAGKIQRYIARRNRAESEEAKPSKKQEAKAKAPKKKKKLTRKQREAAEALKKEEAYQQTVQTIVGFVVTFVAVVAGVIFVINRKLKAAGIYYPADPAAKSTGCC